MLSLDRSLTSPLCVQVGLQGLCEPLEGDYLNMPFEDATFDAAFAIEATCHAPEVFVHKI